MRDDRKAGEAVERSASAPVGSPSQARVLVVDDDEATVHLLESLLRKRRYGAIASTIDGEKALELIDSFDPDLVILDLHLPGVTGFDVLRAARARRDDYLPVLVMTADRSPTVKQRALSAGATDFLTKPVDLTEAGLRIANLVEIRLLERILRSRAAALERSKDQFAQFAYVAAHELSQPLQAIASYAYAIAGGRLDNVRETAATMGVAIERMQGMIADLLAYSEGGATPRRSPVALGEVVDDALAELAPTLEEAEAVVAHDGLPTVVADAEQLRQVMRNLVHNAVKYRADEPPRVRIDAERDTSGWTITVGDNGIGFPDDDVMSLFELFRRSPSTRDRSGSGIGLAVCRRIVEAHGGEIWAEPRPGGGSLVRFTLPQRAGDKR